MPFGDQSPRRTALGLTWPNGSGLGVLVPMLGGRYRLWHTGTSCPTIRAGIRSNGWFNGWARAACRVVTPGHSREFLKGCNLLEERIPIVGEGAAHDIPQRFRQVAQRLVDSPQLDFNVRQRFQGQAVLLRILDHGR